MANKYKLAGCVILYHPELASIDYIKSYIDYLDKLFIVDNGQGEAVYKPLQEVYDYIEVLNYDNMGIAKPLNDVLQLCQGKYDFLLTMDQDSYFDVGVFDKYVGQIQNFDWDKTLSIAPCVVDYDESVKDVGLKFQETARVITSGNIVHIKNAHAIGGYDEKLFIDEVDFEICYRAARNGLKVYEYESGIYLRHCLGNNLEKTVLFKKRSSLNHGAIRKYYMFRNRLYVYDKYKDMDEKFFYKHCIRRNFRDIRKILLVEEDKWNKLKHCWRAYQDYKAGRMGKIGL